MYAFGQDVDTTPVDDEWFVAKVKICTSPTFFGWVFSFCGKITVTGPDGVADKFEKMIKETVQNRKFQK